MATVENIPVDDISPDPNQPRKLKDLSQIKALAQNMKQKGVGMINPIEVDDQGVIVTGEIRWLAAKELGLPTIPVRRYIPETPELRFLRQVSENLHQASVGIMRMSPMDTARAFRHLVEVEGKGKLGPLAGEGATPARLARRGRGGDVPEAGATADQGQRRLARRLGVHETTIREYLRHLDSEYTPPALQKALEQEKVQRSVVRAINRAPEEHRTAFATKVIQETKNDRRGIDRESADAVSRVLRREPNSPADVIGVLRAGQDSHQTEARLREVAPTLAEAVEDAVDAGERIIKKLGAARAALRDLGGGDSLASVPRRAVIAAAQQLREAIDDFLAATTDVEELAPIEGEVLQIK